LRAEHLIDRSEIEAFLRRDTLLHLYELGDLDDFFWPHTTWFGLRAGRASDMHAGGEIAAVALLYHATELPVLLGLSAPPLGALADLLAALRPHLPPRFYAHLSGDLAAIIAPAYRVEPHGGHLKMALADPARALEVDCSAAARLTPADGDAVLALYRASYPGNWFDPRMLETGQYFGIWEGSELVSVAGVHVYSPRYRAAALGNVTTRPDRRGRGLATAASARLIRSLLASADHIGLNVAAANASAIACYQRLGFVTIGDYEEALFTPHAAGTTFPPGTPRANPIE
jgi:GNAT superfamily N-acetyltransferase